MRLIVWTTPPYKMLSQHLGPIIALAKVDHQVVELNPEQENLALPVTGEGDVLLVLGMAGVKALAAVKVVPKGRAIQSLRARPWRLATGAHALVSYTPLIRDVDYAKFIDLQSDLRAACRFVSTGQYLPQVGKYRYVNDFSEGVQWIKDRYNATGKQIPVTLDTETLGLDPYALEAYIESIQITYRPGTADVIRFRCADICNSVNTNMVLRSQIMWLVTSPIIALRMANGKYDANWMHKMWGIEVGLNFGFDTTLVGNILDENRSNSLTVHAKLHSNLGGYDDEFNIKYDKSRMDAVPDDDFLMYAGGDTDSCYQVSEEMKKLLLKDKRLTTFYTTILHPAARAYEQVERVGWCVDVPYYRQLRSEIEAEMAGWTKQMREIIGGKLIARHTDRKKGTLNLAKPRLLIDFFFSPRYLNLKPKLFTEGSTKEHKVPSVAMEHLLMFRDNPKAAPMVALLSEYMSATKTLGTYVNGFLNHLRDDGRWHPNYFLFSGMDEVETEGGAVTGRLSVKNPAIQTIPKHTIWAARLRRAVIAPPGYLILSDDYSQGELKIAACLANEPTMLKAYQSGLDLHAITAARLSGYDLDAFLKLKETDPEKFEAIRYLGKAGNFGLIYGMQVGDIDEQHGYLYYVYANYNKLTLTKEQGEKHHNAFFGMYSKLPDWHEECRKQAKMHGFIRSPLGRIRHLPMIHSRERGVVAKELRRAINSPVQATLSDMALWATGIMWLRGELKRAPVFGMVHDQLLSYVPEDHWEEVAKERKEVMENLPFHEVQWQPQLRFTVDTEIGSNLGELKKYKPLCG